MLLGLVKLDTGQKQLLRGSVKLNTGQKQLLPGSVNLNRGQKQLLRSSVKLDRGGFPIRVHRSAQKQVLDCYNAKRPPHPKLRRPSEAVVMSL